MLGVLFLASVSSKFIAKHNFQYYCVISNSTVIDCTPPLYIEGDCRVNYESNTWLFDANLRQKQTQTFCFRKEDWKPAQVRQEILCSPCRSFYLWTMPYGGFYAGHWNFSWVWDHLPGEFVEPCYNCTHMSLTEYLFKGWTWPWSEAEK